ncbi:hypothetical protein GCM10012288_03300 [Malaciobacter pacificus]|uniref:Uncharacterized protein n=1 Tax=Malaciobacter pacificus TaxID=1080223 RepID=A0A5C2H446_9BACT|nr:hypothetical protein [Malaciobacter pacificus]QEP33711.1 hypothetical protein APAC_0561 [Malaciobacter pacificus]GGD32692.1 hypothetical protein GCM10012288_03300 [Malaciobacter pacificus]
MNLLLICETAIIEHIFTLVCKKLNIDLTVQKNNNVEDRYDLIVIDQNFIDDKFNIIKQFSKKLGAISSEELPFDKSRDFIIPRPFLPTKLTVLLQEQMDVIKEEAQVESYKKEKVIANDVADLDYEEEDVEVTVPVTAYVDSLANDIYEQIEEENDESIVNLATLKSGGVLDLSELSKINDILKEESIQDEINLEKEDWKNISDIIDDALEEVKEYEFDLEQNQPKPYNLVLSHYQIDELKPLLEKFNQTIIDKLANGETVDVKIALKEKN